MRMYFDFATWRRMVGLAWREPHQRTRRKLLVRLLVTVPLIASFHAVCFFLDGLLFPGLRKVEDAVAHADQENWRRTDPETKIHALWLQHYGYDGSDPTRRYWGERQCVWFDDVVVATEYIGPMRP